MTERDLLRACIQCELSRVGRQVTLTGMLKQRFLHDTNASRIRHILRSGLFGLAVINLFIFAELHLVPDVIGLAGVLHVLFTVLSLALLFATAQGMRPGLREAAHSFIITWALLGDGLLFVASSSPDRCYLAVTLLLFIIYANVVIRLRTAGAMTVTIAACGLATLCMVLSTGIPLGVRETILFSIFCTGAFTLYGNHVTQAEERRAYVLALQQTLGAEELQENNAHLSLLSTTDWLTGTANRRGLDLHLAQAWRCAQQCGQPLGVLMIDVDHFKQYNDLHGHLAGDACLARLSALVGQHLRQEADYLCRYGGEEFAVVLGGATLAETLQIAERIHGALEDLALPHGGPGAGTLVTVSIGAAAALPGQGGSPEQLLLAADRALYQAKRRGRNRTHPAPLLSAETVRLAAKG
jgi:diguanylate cyclase (GGDEF)-like protein